MSAHFRHMLTASVTAVALCMTATPALAQETEAPASASATAPATEAASPAASASDAPAAQPKDILLQVGSTESEANLNWTTAAGVTGQKVQFAPAGTDLAQAATVDATSTDSTLYTGVGYKDAGNETYGQFGTHKATITGLSENTEYSYRVGSETTGWSEIKTFNTGTFGDDWNFLFVGDVQLYNTKDLTKQTDAWTKNITDATSKYPKTSFILSAGDQANHSAYNEHAGFIAPEAMKKYRTAVNKGNHELVDEKTYEAMYNRPNLTEENYWYEHNNALVISLDSNDYEDVEEDRAFLKDTVAAHGADKDWIIVTYHHSSFSQAYHQDDVQVKYWREKLTPTLSELDVDLVLGGHDHIYTRSHLMKGYDPVDPGRTVEKGEVLHPKKGEVQYLAANSASGSKFYPMYDFETGEDDKSGLSPDQAKKQEKSRSYTAVWDQNEVADYTNIDVTGDSLTVTTYDTAAGDIVDKFTLSNDSKDQESPVVPSKPSEPGTPGSSAGGSSHASWFAPLLAVFAAVGGFFALAPQLKVLAEKFGIKLPF